MTDSPDDVDWSITSWAGNRRRQMEDFRALTFRDKLRAIEQMEEVARAFQRARPSMVKEGKIG